MFNCLAVGLGGFLGSVCRYLISLIPLGKGTPFPLHTLAINLIGAFVIGLLASAALRGSPLSPRMLLFFKTGVCGGFTTFSTFALETGDLLHGGHPWLASIYAVLSLVLGVAAVFAGQSLAR